MRKPSGTTEDGIPCAKQAQRQQKMQNEMRLQSNGIRRLIKYVIISMINRVGKNQR